MWPQILNAVVVFYNIITDFFEPLEKGPESVPIKSSYLPNKKTRMVTCSSVGGGHTKTN